MATFLILATRKHLDKNSSLVIASLMLFWGVGVCKVNAYFTALALMERDEPQARKRKVSSVAVLPALENGDPATTAQVVLTEDHLKQLEAFQDYVRRTSWCTVRLEKGGNSLQVPENRF